MIKIIPHDEKIIMNFVWNLLNFKYEYINTGMIKLQNDILIKDILISSNYYYCPPSYKDENIDIEIKNIRCKDIDVYLYADSVVRRFDDYQTKDFIK